MRAGVGAIPDPPRPLERIETARLVLRRARVSDASARVDFVLRNRDHLAPWEPVWPAAYYTQAWWERRLADLERDQEAFRAVVWGVALRDDPQRIIATIKFDQIAQGVFRSCMLGYALDAGLEGRGFMTEALRAAIDDVFDRLRLHRIQANHMPENSRSAAVLRRLGFVREGVAPKYLFIRGEWSDHVLTALLNPRFDDRWMEMP